MTNNYIGERWKPVDFELGFHSNFRLEVSNFGRVKSFNKISKGDIINGSMVNGYKIIRLKFFRPREPKAQAKIDALQQNVFKIQRKLKEQKLAGESKATIAETTALLLTAKKTLTKKSSEDIKARSVYHHALIHRLVADYFLKPPTDEQTVVGHLDYDKLNNRSYNLKWMTKEENFKHQRKSPHVIREVASRRERAGDRSSATKLSVTKVMLMKKLFAQDKPMSQLVKQFKVTSTQILRIKRGENWGDVPAAK